MTAIVLAAGRSRRMGQPKMLLPFGGATVFETTVAHILDAGVPHIVVVLGDENGLYPVVQGRRDWAGRVVVVRNHDPDVGMLSSVQQGVSAVPEGSHFLLALGDQPAIPSAVIKQLLNHFLVHQPEVLQPVYNGKAGHPVLFNAAVRAQVLELAPPSTLRDLVHSRHRTLLPVASEAVNIDLDYPSDYEAALARWTSET